MTPAYHLIHFEGLVDISRYPEIRRVFLTAPDAVPVLIDLSLVESVDSTFLSEMLMFRRRHGAAVVALIPPRGNLARVFAIAEMGERMLVFADLSAAVAALGLRAPVGETRTELTAD